MEINEFSNKVRSAVERELGGEYRVELKEVCKNNGIMLHGLLISSDSCNVVPTIYLDQLWRAYEEGMTFAEVVRRLLEVYGRDKPTARIDMDFFKDFERVRDRICYRLVGRERNRQLLEKVPHVEFLDMAVCFFYAYKGELLGEGSILIYNSHMEMWKADTSEMMKLACRNTPRLFPWQCSTMEEVLREAMGGEDGRSLLSQGIPMRILSNRQRVNGAGCLMYRGVLEQLAEECGADLYILPSSVHEVILLPAGGREEPGELRSIIGQVNRTQVAPEEVLSDSLYLYDRRKKEVEIIF